MEFYDWTIELGENIIPFTNEELRKAVFVRQQDSYNLVTGEISFNDQGQLTFDLPDFKTTILGDKHLRIEDRYPIHQELPEVPAKEEDIETVFKFTS